MLKQITRLALLSSLLMLAIAAPANASNKTAAKAYRSLAKSVNATHAAWKAAAPQAKLDSQAALAEAEAACLPAFTAASNGPSDSAAQITLWLAAAAMVNSTGTDDSLHSIQNDFLVDKVASLRDDYLLYGTNSRSWLRFDRGLEAFEGMAAFVDGFYISPTDLCAAAEAWQADNFAAKKAPRSLRRLNADFFSSVPEKRLRAAAKDLRRYGASSNAAYAFTQGFSNPALGADSMYETPLFKALTEDENTKNSLADIKAQMQALQQK
jgi:hypothetical protein